MFKTIEICIGTDRSKTVRARLSLLIKEGGAVHFEHYHSVPLPPGCDSKAIRAAVEAHLASTKGGIPFAPWPAIPDAEWADVEAHCAIIHKPAVVEAYRVAQLEAAKILKGAD